MSDPISELLTATAEALQDSVGALTKIEREAFTRVLREKLGPLLEAGRDMADSDTRAGFDATVEAGDAAWAAALKGSPR